MVASILLLVVTFVAGIVFDRLYLNKKYPPKITL